MSSSLAVRSNAPVAPRQAAIVVGIGVALLWLIELVDQITRGSLDALGIHSWQVWSLPSIFLAPWLHADWAHLSANTLPFAVLGFLVMIGGAVRAVLSTLWSVVVSGLSAWLLSAPNTITIGASGLIFGWLTYLLTRGLFARNGKQILLAVVIFVVYGGILWGVFPTQAGVSWQAHLGGAIGGVLAAWSLHRRRTARAHG
ncbi:rhomboid family intramembrane serine protease [Micropruina sp.]|uniref:rhomboid family intramembrane serine protease n=1 Tax=Micropruina sp. TaxID=2737536 RepID=UPI0026049441|nr:rhomboid family intramembrane serine protease [Micropruina sp.]